MNQNPTNPIRQPTGDEVFAEVIDGWRRFGLPRPETTRIVDDFLQLDLVLSVDATAAVRQWAEHFGLGSADIGTRPTRVYRSRQCQSYRLPGWHVTVSCQMLTVAVV